MQTNDVKVALNQQRVAFFLDASLGRVQPVKLGALGIKFGLGGVDIFGRVIVGGDGAPAKTQGMLPDIDDRKDDAMAKAVIMAVAIFRAIASPARSTRSEEHTSELQ